MNLVSENNRQSATETVCNWINTSAAVETLIHWKYMWNRFLLILFYLRWVFCLQLYTARCTAHTHIIPMQMRVDIFISIYMYIFIQHEISINDVYIHAGLASPTHIQFSVSIRYRSLFSNWCIRIALHCIASYSAVLLNIKIDNCIK